MRSARSRFLVMLGVYAVWIAFLIGLGMTTEQPKPPNEPAQEAEPR